MKRLFLKYILIPLAVFCLLMASLPALLFADPAEDLADAMEVPFTSATVDGDFQAYGTFYSFGNITPKSGDDFTVLSTGIADPYSGSVTGEDLGAIGPDGDSTTMTHYFTMPSGKNSFTFNFYFVSAEYPDFVGSQYNDTFTATISGSSLVADGTNIAHDVDNNDISVNSVNFTGESSDLSGTKFESYGGTGWLTAGASANPSDNVSVMYNILDLGDGFYTSSVLLDNFKFGTEQIETGVQEEKPVKSKKKAEPEPEPEPWVRNHEFQCWQVWVNEDNAFEFVFVWEYYNNNHVQILDRAGNIVFYIDLPKGDTQFVADLPDGTYVVQNYHEYGHILQEFVIGKP